MKIYDIISPAVSAASSVNTVQVDLGDLQDYSYQVEFTGSNVVGTLTLQCRDDEDYSWVTIPGSSQAVTASTNHMYSVVWGTYRYVRLVWTYTSGTGNIKVKAILKENVIKGA